MQTHHLKTAETHSKYLKPELQIKNGHEAQIRAVRLNTAIKAQMA